MIVISVSESEYYDRSTETFRTCHAQTLKLEHSLVAISKWESKWLKPFIGVETKTVEETYDYIRCMVVDNDAVDDITIKSISQSDMNRINEYIQAPMTATTIKTTNNKKSRDIITSELIYYWMVSFTIPFECQHWHINRLLTLINVCNVKNAPSKKENPKETMSRNAALNAARKKAMNTSG